VFNKKLPEINYYCAIRQRIKICKEGDEIKKSGTAEQVPDVIEDSGMKK
jgi:hypothetical protein